MCGRSTLTKPENEVEVRFNATFDTEELERYNPLPNYNVAPTQMMPAITQGDPSVLQLYRWGLIPSWAKDTKIGAQMINARVETLTEKAAFKKLITTRRCILPLDGFYEWKKEGKEKLPFRICTSDQQIFSVAGLWDMWRDPVSGNEIYSFTMITLAANEMMSAIHDRMPAILRKEEEAHWLSHDIPQREIMDIIQPYPTENMYMYRVSTKVNSVREQGAQLIELYTPDEGTPQQLSLF